MSVIAGEKQQDQQHDQQHVPPPKGAGDPLPELTHEPSVDEIAKIIAANPARRDSIMSALHQRMGNGFVQQVIVALAARPAPTALGLPPAADNKTDAILKSNASALDKGRGLGEVGFKNLTELDAQLVPAYKRARDVLDAQSVKELGDAVVMALQYARAASQGLAHQLALVVPQDQAGADVAIEGAEAAQSTSLQYQLDMLRQLIPMAELTALNTLTPMTFRGAALSPEAPVVDEATLAPTLLREIQHTVEAINFVIRTSKRLQTPGQDAVEQARFELAGFHRPVDLELVRAGLMATGKWDLLDANGAAPVAKAGPLAFETCSEAGPATDLVTEREGEAKQHGWLTDTGYFDSEVMRSELREGSHDSVIHVYQLIMSAEPAGRVKLLEQIKREGLMSRWLELLPWSYAKEIHDSLPSGNAAIKSDLQASFQQEGHWGTDLAEKEYKAPSLTKMFHDDMATHPENAATDYAYDTALNYLTLDFMHGYGENEDAHNDGAITDAEYDRKTSQVSAHTTAEAGVMMATGGLGEMMPEMEASTTAGGKAVAAALEGGTVATAGAMAVDTVDVASGAKSEMNTSVGYLETYLIAGGISAATAGLSALLSKRSKKYLPGAKLTLAQHLAEVNPALAQTLGSVARGETVQINVSLGEIDALERRGVIDRSTAQQLRPATANGQMARAEVIVVADLAEAGQTQAFWLTNTKVESIGTVGGRPYVTDASQLVLPQEVAPAAGEVPKLPEAKPGPAVGRRIATAAEGHEILQQLVLGDEEGLRRLGVTGPIPFRTNTREWTLVDGGDGFAIYMGGEMTATTPGELETAGHTHPATNPDGTPRVLADRDGRSPTWNDIETDQAAFKAGEAGLMPSAHDIEVLKDGGRQMLHTPFAMKQGQIVSAGTEGAGGQISIEISGRKQLRTTQQDTVNWYEATITAYEKGRAAPLMSRKMYFRRIVGGDGYMDRRVFELTSEWRRELIDPPT